MFRNQQFVQIQLRFHRNGNLCGNGRQRHGLLHMHGDQLSAGDFHHKNLLQRSIRGIDRRRFALQNMQELYGRDVMQLRKRQSRRRQRQLCRMHAGQPLQQRTEVQYVFQHLLHTVGKNVFGLWLQDLHFCRKSVFQRTTAGRRLSRNRFALRKMRNRKQQQRQLHQRQPVFFGQILPRSKLLLLYQFRSKKRLGRQRRMQRSCGMLHGNNLYRQRTRISQLGGYYIRRVHQSHRLGILTFHN